MNRSILNNILSTHEKGEKMIKKQVRLPVCRLTAGYRVGEQLICISNR